MIEVPLYRGTGRNKLGLPYPDKKVELACRGTSIIRNCFLLGPCSRPMPGALRWSWGGRLFLMSEETLYLA
jgi:hypothetical protein